MGTHTKNNQKRERERNTLPRGTVEVPFPTQSQTILCFYLPKLSCLFPFDPLDFPVFIPDLFASLLFSPCDWISYTTHWQRATESSQKRAHFSGNPASFPVNGRWQRRAGAESAMMASSDSLLRFGNSSRWSIHKSRNANVPNLYLLRKHFYAWVYL